MTFKPWHDENEEEGKNDPGRGNSKCNGPGARTRLSMFRNSKGASVTGRITKVSRLEMWSGNLRGLDSKAIRDPRQGAAQENSAKETTS